VARRLIEIVNLYHYSLLSSSPVMLLLVKIYLLSNHGAGTDLVLHCF